MFKKFGTDSRSIVADAREIASALASPTIEAEHLLLAVAGQPATRAQQVLLEAGLDSERVHDALDAEFEQSLAAVGISLSDFDLSATREPARIARWGTSAKLALARAAKIADARRDRRLTPGHILLGVLKAPTGTVPRALDRAGVDRTELGGRIEAVL
jgi:ATP-dependent Clp protease ATP-binding subunit ClpA